MAVSTSKDGQVIVSLPGEIDLANVSEFEQSLDQAMRQSPEGFIIDLTDTMYIDSAGVQAILAAYSKMHVHEGRLVIVIGNLLIKSVIEVVHLEQLPGVTVFDDLAAARQGLASLESQR